MYHQQLSIQCFSRIPIDIAERTIFEELVVGILDKLVEGLVDSCVDRIVEKRLVERFVEKIVDSCCVDRIVPSTCGGIC